MKLSRKQVKIRKHIDDLGICFGVVTQYSKRDIYLLWKESGVTFDDVSDYFCKSYERARQYCYGQNCSNKLKIQVARYFKGVIYGGKK